MTNALLEIKSMSGGYDKGQTILENISFSINEGEVVGVLGLNGSGKSTLGKMLMNMLPFRLGEIYYDGSDVSKKSTWELIQAGMAIMHQGAVVFQGLTVWENLRMASFGENAGIDAILESMIPLLERPKKQLMKMKAGNLSGGERHELALAMSLARNPGLIILDEPSAGLSPTSMDSAYMLLEKIKKTFGTTMILIEQNVSRACSFCDRCLMIEHKNIKKEFPRGELELENIEKVLFNDK